MEKDKLKQINYAFKEFAQSYLAYNLMENKYKRIKSILDEMNHDYDNDSTYHDFISIKNDMLSELNKSSKELIEIMSKNIIQNNVNNNILLKMKSSNHDELMKLVIEYMENNKIDD